MTRRPAARNVVHYRRHRRDPSRSLQHRHRQYQPAAVAAPRPRTRRPLVGVEIADAWRCLHLYRCAVSGGRIRGRRIYPCRRQVIAGKTVPLVPRHKLNLNASWTINPQTRLNAMMTYVGEQFMDNDEGNTLGSENPRLYGRRSQARAPQRRVDAECGGQQPVRREILQLRRAQPGRWRTATMPIRCLNATRR